MRNGNSLLTPPVVDHSHPPLVVYIGVRVFVRGLFHIALQGNRVWEGEVVPVAVWEALDFQ